MSAVSRLNVGCLNLDGLVMGARLSIDFWMLVEMQLCITLNMIHPGLPMPNLVKTVADVNEQGSPDYSYQSDCFSKPSQKLSPTKYGKNLSLCF